MSSFWTIPYRFEFIRLSRGLSEAYSTGVGQLGYFAPKIYTLKRKKRLGRRNPSSSAATSPLKWKFKSNHPAESSFSIIFMEKSGLGTDCASLLHFSG
ncbi:hypothetical protein PCASD_17716 [Puccinia coronata f. sp. avenae]|uniref:Uncharacterized protein n=1 Tax=Puccinia coronata f. sp. avenae TaxID=200324 RepID=A0A2N5T3C0_9BASI|nr:hypothetical protein PCASD_17716 [Puccinia coronata f. sp. avenae]